MLRSQALPVQAWSRAHRINKHVTDAYFDNFRVTALYGVGAAGSNDGQAAPAIGLDGMLNLTIPFEDLP